MVLSNTAAQSDAFRLGAQRACAQRAWLRTFDAKQFMAVQRMDNVGSQYPTSMQKGLSSA